MNKLLKWSLIASGAIVVLMILAVLIIPRFVDLNSYRPEIERKITQATGRPFVLGGELDLSIFPWMGIALSDISLGNPKGFDEKEFITVKRFEVRVKLLPLLSKTVQVKKFVVEKPEIFLVKNKNGETNWTMAQTGTSTEQKQPGKATPADSKPEMALPIKALFVDEFAVKNGIVHYRDKLAKIEKKVSDINLALGNISFEKPINLEFSALADGQPISLEGLMGPLGKEPGKGSIPLNMTLKALDQITLTLKGAVIDPIKAMGFDLNVALSPFSPKKLMAVLGNSNPIITADPKVLDRISMNIKIKGDPKTIAVSQGILTLDDSTMKFSALIKDFSKPDLTFDMALDQINLDRYLPPQKPSDKAPETAEPHPATAPKAGVNYAPLRKIILDGKVKIGMLVAKQAKLENIQIEVKGKNGLFNLEPLSLNLYQGTIASNASLDVSTNTPKIKLNVDAKKIASGPLITDLLKKEIIQGQLESNLTITARGDTPDTIKKSLNGKGNLKFTDGAIIGIDIPGMVRNIKASFGSGEKTTEKPHTDFAEFLVPFTMTNGLVDATGTSLASPLLRVNVKGTTDLVTETLDMGIMPKFVSTLKGQGDTEERSGIMVPILITGTFDKPKFSPDLKSMVTPFIKDGKIDKEEIKKTQENIKQIFKGFSVE